MEKRDFLYGVQYYRAPTPEPEDWENDLRNIRENGFRDVKFWVQWRWTHRGEDEFYFADTDRLMELAQQNGLRVTLNVIFDVAPKWVTDRWPESAMVMADGRRVEPTTACYRQIGGFPGPCYNHEQAFAARMKFLQKTVERYRSHPAMYMWDVWNEPEQCSPYRAPHKETLVCFCPACRSRFGSWLQKKYGSIEKLNRVWGRCYSDFADVELPTEPASVFSDFIDFRRFHLEKMTAEANSRLQVVRSLDPAHAAYLHVVPNTSGIFNALTGVDDFALAKNCDVFASTNFAQPVWSILTLSAGRGKTCYNVECHVGAGSTKTHQRQITPGDLVRELLPQVGLGIRGFLFWQYRAELLGFESPSWGVTNPDGSIGSVGVAAKSFIEGLQPYLPQILQAAPQKPQIAIWKDCTNETFQFCVNNELESFAKSIEAYVNAAYENNYSCCIVDDAAVKEGLDDVKLLIMPSCYAADEELLQAVDRFVQNGGTLLCEAHLGGYDVQAGRHSKVMPGMGMAQRWGIREKYTTSSYHLKTLAQGQSGTAEGLTGDVKKALDTYGVSGGKYFAVNTVYGFAVTGAERFACLEAPDAQVLGRFGEIPCMVLQHCGKGKILYCGTNLGEAAAADPQAFEKLVMEAAKLAGAETNPMLSPLRGVHVDRLSDTLLVVSNSNTDAVPLQLTGNWKGVFSGRCSADGRLTLEAQSAELLVRQD